MAYGEDTRTLIATFDDYSVARQAARELETSGIASENIHVDSNRKTAGAGSVDYSGEEHHESGFKAWWNSLFGSSDDDQDRNNYEGALDAGRSVLRATVAAPEVDRVAEILNQYGARDVDTGGTSTATATRDTTERRGVDTRARSAESTKGPIELVEEELQVGKRAVRRGGVRVYSHVVTQPVEQQVRLREEHVNVERRKVDRELGPGEANALRDQTIEVTEMAEEPVIAKRTRVREEVVVGKQTTERTETVRDNVRRTEVNVEQLGPETETRTGGRTTGTMANQATSTDLIEDYRRDYRTRYGSDADFTSMQPAYEYGYRCASNPEYRGRSWDDVENDVRVGYQREYPTSRWEQVKDSIRYGWDKVTRKR